MAGILMFALTRVVVVQGADPSQAAKGVVIKAIGQVWIGQSNQKDERVAGIKDALQETEYLRTGKKSFAEIEFSNTASARLGPLSSFHFSTQNSNYVLDQGEGLFSFPKGKGGYTVSTPAFAAGIEGTTVYVKVTRSVVEYACLEGRCRIGPHTLTPGQRLALSAREAAYAAPKQTLNLDKFLEKNLLATIFDKPLLNLPLIREESRKQKEPRTGG